MACPRDCCPTRRLRAQYRRRTSFLDDAEPAAVGDWPVARQIRDWIQDLRDPELIAVPDAQRLLELGQPTASVIFAFRALEQALRLALRRREPGVAARRATLAQLIREAEAKELLGSEDVRTIRKFIGLRNLAVHGARDITQEAAASAIAAVGPIAARLRAI